MIKTQGLQIGNYVYFKETFDLCEVVLIHGDNHYDCRDHETSSFICNGNYEYIPLNDETISRIEKVDNMQIYKGNVNIFCDEEYSDIDVRLPEYFHQLQNLYYALTGEKLTIKKL